MSKALRCILIDLKGTLYLDNEIIPGAVQALEKLRKTKFSLRFLSNDSRKSKKTLCSDVLQYGLKIYPEEVHSCIGAARHLIFTNHLKPFFLLCPEVMEDFKGFECKNSEVADAVIVGDAPMEFRYEKLNDAFRHLRNGAQLIALCSYMHIKRDEALALGPGCFIKGLEHAAQCSATLVGKPDQNFFLAAIGRTPASEAIIIGDDVKEDIRPAQKIGITAYLVKTGVYAKGDENKVSEGTVKVVSNFTEAVEAILKSYEYPSVDTSEIIVG